MKISVVTVCYNEESSIRQTIESVLKQDYSDLEYIIVDGKSEDRTYSIISEYMNDSRVKAVSEPDTGLFNAMNKSLEYITGDYVIFMNSGDWFYDETVLSDVSDELRTDVVYGDVFRRTSKTSYIQRYKGTHLERMTMMLCGLAFCHQTQFTRTSIMREYRFRESHRITADYDLVVRLLGDNRSFEHINRIISSFDNEGGISAQKDNYLEMVREDDESIREVFPGLFYLTIIPKRIYRQFKRRKCNYD